MKRRYSSVRRRPGSTDVALYSGHMLESVARSAIVSDEAGPVELDEAPHDAVCLEHLGERRQHEIRRPGSAGSCP